MTVGAAGYSSTKPGQYDPSWGVPTPTRIWGTTGNTDTVIDASVHPGQCIIITPTVTINGTSLAVTSVSQGTFTVTSTDSEDAGTTYTYFLCGN